MHHWFQLQRVHPQRLAQRQEAVAVQLEVAAVAVAPGLQVVPHPQRELALRLGRQGHLHKLARHRPRVEVLAPELVMERALLWVRPRWIGSFTLKATEKTPRAQPFTTWSTERSRTLASTTALFRERGFLERRKAPSNSSVSKQTIQAV